MGARLPKCSSQSFPKKVEEALPAEVREALLPLRRNPPGGTVDYGVALSLPLLGFVFFWGAVRVLVWIWVGFSEQPTPRRQGQTAGR